MTAALGHLRRTADGVGLGLYLVRLLTEELEGELDVSSKPGEGTTVTVTLPDLPYGSERDPAASVTHVGTWQPAITHRSQTTH